MSLSKLTVPREYVQGGEIVLNVSMDATSSLKLGNEFIEFKARFGGKPRDIMVPIHRVMAIYARENGQGMAFPVSDEDSKPIPVHALAAAKSIEQADEPPQPPPAASGRPALKRIK